MTSPVKRIDESAAKARFDAALTDHAQDFETFFLARFMGLEFAYLPAASADQDKEVCQITFHADPMLFNPQGSLHGGIMASVMDISMGHLVNKVAGPGATVEMKVQFLRPVAAGQATVEGRFLQRGRRLSFMESRLFDADETLCAIATATWKMPNPDTSRQPS